MNSVKNVKKVFTKSIPRYYLRSRKVHAPIFVRPVRPKQDQETQADLSDEDWEALFAELPFHFLSSPESDTEVEEHINPSPSYTYPIPSSSQVPATSRRSTAFCTPTQAELTDFDPRDISVDSDESFVCPSNSEELRDTHTPRTCPERSYQFSPFYIEHSKEESSDSYIDDKPDQSSNGNRNAKQLPPLVINSPADLIKLVARRPFPERDNLTEDSFESSASENEATSQASNFTDDNEKDHPLEELSETNAMSAELLKGLQEQMVVIQAQLATQQVQQNKTASAFEHSPIPEVASAHRPVPFHGYDAEDVNRWLDKLEYYLKLRRIDTASPTALAELVLNLAGPAEDFFFSLPDDRKETFELLRDALKERFSNDNQSWITWQAVTTRQQWELEPLDTYLTELTNNFRRLHITDAEKMRYFVQGLRSEVRKAVLMKQPKSFREAEKMARLACSVENTMNTSRGNCVAAQIGNLSQTVKSLLSAGVTPNAQSSTDDKKLLTVIEKNALLANLSTALAGKPSEPLENCRVKFASQNNGSATVAALANSRNEQVFIGKSDFQELKDLLLDKIDSQNRHFDARKRGLARRSQGQREEIPRQRTRVGQPRCYTSGQTGHLAINCPERRDPRPQPFLQESYPARRSNYQPYSSYNQQRDNYRNLPQQNRRELNLAALDEHLANEGFVAELERTTSNWVSTDSQEPLHKKGKIMQNTSVNIYSSEAVMFSKQNSRNSENLHRRLTPRCPPPFSGKGKQTFQYVKPPAKRETQPNLGHVPEPARTPENNVENIQEEIKSYLSSALELFGRLPSGPITTGHPGTQSYQAESSHVVVSQGSTPQSSCLSAFWMRKVA